MGTGTLDNFFEDLKQVKATVKVKPKPKKSKPATPSNVYIEELSEIEGSKCPVCGLDLKELTHAYINLQFVSETTLEEKKEAISYDMGYTIRPYPQSHSTFGGSYGSGAIILRENMAQLFPMLMDWRRSHLDMPFMETLEDAYRFSNLKPEHIFINVSEGTVKWIENNTNRSWMDFLKEWNAIDVMAIPDGYVELVDREHELETQLEKVKKEITPIEWGFKGYSGSSRFDLENPNGVRMAIEKLDELKELLPVKLRLKNQLEDVKEEIQELLEGE